MKGIIKVLDSNGHTTVEWNESEEQIATAKEVFDNQVAAGYMAFVIDQRDKSKGRLLTEFDPEAEEILITPPIYGG
jgi:hypothetical protein